MATMQQRMCTAPKPPPTCKHVLQQQGQQRRQQRRNGVVAVAAAAAAASPGETAAAPQPAALILEADSVLADVVVDGHRVAFNRAFVELGIECANFTPAIYHDLVAQNPDGTGEGIVRAWFTRTNWPLTVPTSEQELFCEKVHALKQRHFLAMVAKREVRLRDGVVPVLRQALAGGARVALVTGTASAPHERVAESLLEQLPEDVAAHVAVYPSGAHAAPDDGDEAGSSSGSSGSSTSGSGGSDGPSAPLGGLAAAAAGAAARVKLQNAEQFAARMAEALQGSKGGAFGVSVDRRLLAAGSGRASPVSAAFLAAVAATLPAPAGGCVLAASSIDLINAALAVGMSAVAIPRKGNYTASFGQSVPKFEGVGPGYCSWPKLCVLWAQQQQAAALARERLQDVGGGGGGGGS